MERVDLTKDVFHKIHPDRENPTTSFENYYNKVHLKNRQKELRVGLTFSINTRLMPQEISVDDPKCYAQLYIYKEKQQEIRKYFVKGNSVDYLFNPHGDFAEGTESQLDSSGGRPIWTFREVKPAAFWYYLMFLQTRNEIHLTQAQRAII
jgi:hypothetical protein